MNNISPECSCGFYDIDDKVRAIYDVQTMLSAIARYDNSIPLVAPDGFYSNETAEAVEQFCRTRGLKIRDTVNETVFYSLVNEYRRLNRDENRMNADFFPNDLQNGIFRKGDKNSQMFIIQSMLSEMGDLCEVYAEVEMTGIFDDKTEKALSRVRSVYGVGHHDTVDKKTWNALAREYNNRKFREIE